MGIYKKKNLDNLILLAQNNDLNALNELIRRYQPKIYKKFFSLNEEADVLDLTQDALLKIIISIKNLKNPKAFNSWVNQIVKNLG